MVHAVTTSPTDPDFWNTRYEAGRTPWDFGGVPAPLSRFLEKHPGNGAHVLIPGCGSGHEVMAFAGAGYNVSAIDFSPVAVARARGNVPPQLAASIVEADFFTHPFDRASFELIYERTFVCALPPELWPRIVARLASLLKPGGTLAGIYFFGDKDDGPPFGLSPDEPRPLFDAFFTLNDDQPIPASESLPLFAGRERWQERRRRDHAKLG